MNNERPSKKQPGQINEFHFQPTAMVRVDETTLAVLDASALVPSAWTPDAFTERNCDDEFKASIQSCGGNRTPVLVQKTTADASVFEIICGHRRVQACRELKLKVFAHVLNSPKSQREIFFTQEYENKSRRDFSCLEQGLRFQKALKTLLFSSQGELAKFIGVSQPWISRVLALAELPKELIHAFDDSRKLQPRHAKKLLPVLKTDRENLLCRAAAFAQLRSANKTRSANETIRYLLGEVKDPADGWRPLISTAPEVGKWRLSTDGETIVRIPRTLSEAELAAIAEIADKSDQTLYLVDNLVITNEGFDAQFASTHR